MVGHDRTGHDNEISRHVVDCAIEANRTLGGPGLLESVYQEALVWELETCGLHVRRQAPVPIVYKGHALRSHFRPDLIIDGKVTIECKAAARSHPIFEAQLGTCLRLTGLKLGMLINFGDPTVTEASVASSPPLTTRQLIERGRRSSQHPTLCALAPCVDPFKSVESV